MESTGKEAPKSQRKSTTALVLPGMRTEIWPIRATRIESKTKMIALLGALGAVMIVLLLYLGHILTPSPAQIGSVTPSIEWDEPQRDCSTGGSNWTIELLGNPGTNTFPWELEVKIVQDLGTSTEFVIMNRTPITEQDTVIFHDVNEDNLVGVLDWFYILGEPYGKAQVNSTIMFYFGSNNGFITQLA